MDDERELRREREEERERDRKRESEEQKLKEEIMLISAALNSIEHIFNRQRKIKDPVVRYSILVDRLLMSLDIGTGFSKAYINDDKYPSDLRDRIDRLSDTIHKDLDGLMDWIQRPIYSPDHPYGNIIKEKSEENYNGNRDKQSQ